MSELTPYELEREERIAKNNAVLEQLGLVDMAKDMQAKQAAGRKLKRQQQLSSSEMIPAERRKSSRLPSHVAGQYDVDRQYKEIEGTARSRSPKHKRSKKGISSGSGNSSRDSRGWNVLMGWSSWEAVEAAREAAHQLQEELAAAGRVAAVKKMSASQVSGGFWMQLPGEFARTWPKREAKETIDIRLISEIDPREFPREKEHATTEKHEGEKHEGWNVVFLYREGGGAGLSGGWVHFAVEQFLMSDDFVVFEKVKIDIIKAHIFRAFDYEPEGARRDNRIQEAMRGASLAGTAAAAAAVLKAQAEEEDEGEDEGEAEGDEDEEEEAEDQGSETAAAVSGGKVEASPAPAVPKPAGRAASQRNQQAKIKGSSSKAGGRKVAPGKAAAEKAAAGKAGSKKKAAGKEEKGTRKRKRDAGAEAKKQAKAKKKAGKVQEEEEEESEDEAEEGFFVRSIQGYREEADGTPKFFIRWWFYGPEDDSWEPIECLDAHPSEYTWNCPIPARYKKGK